MLSCSFYSQTESLHKTAEMVGMRVGLIGMEKGVSFLFLLYVTDIIVLLKNRICFPIHLEIVLILVVVVVFIYSSNYSCHMLLIQQPTHR